MNATENLAHSTAPVTETPAPVPVPPSPPSPPPPPDVETPPIPVEMPTDSPVVPIVLEAPAASLPQTGVRSKGVADLVFLANVSGSMATCIDAQRSNIEAFIDSLSRSDANNAARVRDWRAKVMGYRDFEVATSSSCCSMRCLASRRCRPRPMACSLRTPTSGATSVMRRAW